MSTIQLKTQGTAVAVRVDNRIDEITIVVPPGRRGAMTVNLVEDTQARTQAPAAAINGLPARQSGTVRGPPARPQDPAAPKNMTEEQLFNTQLEHYQLGYQDGQKHMAQDDPEKKEMAEKIKALEVKVAALEKK